MIQLELVPKRAFSRELEVLHDGRVLTRLGRAHFREQGGFELGGVHHELRARGFFGNRIELLADGRALASAKRSSFWRGSYEITWLDGGEGQGPWSLRRGSAWGSRFVLETDGLFVGEVERRGWFKRGARLRVEEGVPPAIAIFFGYLAVTFWDRQTAAAAS